MASKKQKAAEKAAAVNEQVTRQQFDVAIPMMAEQQTRGLQESMFPNARFLPRALELQGTASIDQGVRAAGRERSAIEAQLAPAASQNLNARFVGPAVNLATFRHGSALTQALANLASGSSALGSTLGLNATGAEQAVGAARQQLAAVDQMSAVNPALVAALAAVDGAYAVGRGVTKYNAGKKAADQARTGYLDSLPSGLA